MTIRSIGFPQFPHIARATVFRTVRRKPRASALSALRVRKRGEIMQEMIPPEWEHPDPFPERRHVERNYVEPVEEIFAEVASLNFFFEVFVGGGDNANVDATGFLCAHGSKRCSSRARRTLACVRRLMSPTHRGTASRHRLF